MKPRETKIGWKKNLDKLLFIVASFYLITALAWLWKQQKPTSLARSNPPVSSPKINNPSSTNSPVKLLSSDDYLSPTKVDQEASLGNNQATSNKKAQEITDQPETPTPLPPEVKVADLSPKKSIKTRNSPITIPQLPPPLPVIEIPKPPPPPLPIIKIPPPPPLPLPTPVALPTKIPPQPKLESSSVPPAKIDKVPVMETVNQEALISSNQGIDSSPSYPMEGNKTDKLNTLVGILELENSSSIALFNINNLTERVKVGSEIGTTGWLLVDINGKQAIINRQNKSLYLSVGEQF